MEVKWHIKGEVDIDELAGILKELLTKASWVKASSKSHYIEVGYISPEDLYSVVEDQDILCAEVVIEDVSVEKLVKILLSLKTRVSIHYSKDYDLTIFCDNKDELLSVLEALSER